MSCLVIAAHPSRPCSSECAARSPPTTRAHRIFSVAMPRRGGKRGAGASDAATPAKRTRAAAQAEAAAAAEAAAQAALADERHRRLLLAGASIAQLAPQDAISHMLAFLDCREFGAAARTCREWRGASLRASSWPPYDTRVLRYKPVRVFFRSRGNWNPAYKNCRPNEAHGSIPLAGGRAVQVELISSKRSADGTYPASGLLEALLQQPAAAFLRALDLRTPIGVSSLQPSLAAHTLSLLPRFPRLQALRLPAILQFPADALAQLGRAVGPRLVELSSEDFAAATSLVNAAGSTLCSLRVLTVASSVDADALLHLRSLERLTLIVPRTGPGTTPAEMQRILHAVRILSVQGSLRSLELRGNPHFVELHGEVLGAHEQFPAHAPLHLSALFAADQQQAVAGLSFLSVEDIDIETSSLVAVLSLPRLTAYRLVVSARRSLAWIAREFASQPMPAAASTVSELQLFVDDEAATQPVPLAKADLASLAARFTRVRTLHTNSGAADFASFWVHFVAHLHELRELTTSWRGQLSYDALWALSSLPHFHTLSIQHDWRELLESRSRFLLPIRLEAPTIRLIAKSSSWRTLMLRGGLQPDTEPLLEPMKAAWLPAVGCLRIVVKTDSGDSQTHHVVYQLQQMAGAAAGVVAWQPVSAPKQ